MVSEGKFKLKEIPSASGTTTAVRIQYFLVEGGANPRGGSKNLLFSKIFAKNFMENERICTERGSLVPPGSANAYFDHIECVQTNLFSGSFNSFGIQLLKQAGNGTFNANGRWSQE